MLRRLNLEGLAGRPIQDVFLVLTDSLCPDGGTIDEAIARDAFIETIAEIVEAGIVDLDNLSVAQMLVIFETFICRSIEGRLYNDVGMKTIVVPTNLQAVEVVQQQIHEFVRGAVHDAVHGLRDQITALDGAQVEAVVSRVYTSSFEVLQVMAEALSQ